LEQEGVQPKCGIAVVNLKTGDLEQLLELQGVVEELYDVGVLSDLKRTRVVGFQNDDIRFFVRPEPLTS
jgi:hypothetical protein